MFTHFLLAAQTQTQLDEGAAALLISILGGAAGVLGIVLIVLIPIALLVLSFLLPWFVWRAKVYQKRTYQELHRLNRRLASRAS